MEEEELKGKNMKNPKGILFDLGDTLLCMEKFDAPAGIAHLHQFSSHSDPSYADAIQKTADEINDELWALRQSSRLEVSEYSYLRLLYDLFNVTFSISEAERELEFWKAASRFSPEPGITELLLYLQTSGIKTGVISNTMFSGGVLEWELEKHDLLKYFEFIMSSADYGIRKPHPLIFRVGLKKLAMEPEDVWFIGDKPQFDVKGALNANIWAVWYNKNHETVDNIKPHAEIQNWKELNPMLV